MDLSALGTATRPMVRVHGGFANRVYRLDTDQGSFAVKQFSLDGRPSLDRIADVLHLERAAFGAGIRMPEPIAADETTAVHRWVEGDPVPEISASRDFGVDVGGILARVHRLDIAWDRTPGEGAAPKDWEELAERATETEQPWAGELLSQSAKFNEIADFVNSCTRPGPEVLTHRDIQPWNLLAQHGHPVVLDWELSGMLDLSGELGSTALSLAKGRGLDDIDPAAFRAVLDGYVAEGGELPTSGPSWFAYLIEGRLSFTRRNLLRCLDGVQAETGPELALAQESAGNGVRELPKLYARVPELVDRLLP